MARSNRPAPANGNEQDAFGAHHTIHGWKPGERRAIRTRANRRARRTTRVALRTGQEV